MAHRVEAAWSLTASPPTGADYPTGSMSYAWSREVLLPETEGKALSLSGASEQNIFPPTMSRAQIIYVRVRGGSVVLHVTSGAGTTQNVPCDSVFFLQSATQPVTGLAVSGTADLEVFIAGE